MDTEKFLFIHHIEELRKRIIFCIFAAILAAAVSYYFAGRLISILTKPAGKLVFIQPQEAFTSYLKISIICGFFISLPFLIYQIYAFIRPALTKKEKQSAIFYGYTGFLLFIIGAGFAYLVVLPYALRFLLSFGGHNLKPMISVGSYLSFLTIMLLSFGAVFELPAVIVFLTKIGIVTPGLLRRNRRYVLLVIFIVAAVLTPPDVFTQILLALPLLLLYEISILLSRMVKR